MKHGLTRLALMAALLPGLPAQAQAPVWDANEVELRSQRLADGVHYMVPTDADEKAPRGIPLATTSGIVVGRTGVLVVDTMLNKRLADKVLAEARRLGGRAAPRYAVNTSYHGDHSYGNMYFPATTTIIQHEATRAYIDSHFAADVKFMIANFGQGRGIEQIKPRTGDILVRAGVRCSSISAAASSRSRTSASRRRVAICGSGCPTQRCCSPATRWSRRSRRCPGCSTVAHKTRWTR